MDFEFDTGINNEEYFADILDKPANQKCFDCNEANPRWVSTNNAVFFCETCALKHKQRQDENTRVKDIDNDQLDVDQQKIISIGGNEQLTVYFA